MTSSVRMKRGVCGVAALALTAAVMTGCSNSTSNSNESSDAAITSETTAASSQSSASSNGTSAANAQSPAATGTATTSLKPGAPAGAGATNVVLTQRDRTELIQALAKAQSLTPADYQGLTKGFLLAKDNGTKELWGAGTAEGKTPKGQVQQQDEGSYIIFRKPANGSWKAHLVNGDPQERCTITVPASVAKLWGWPANSCRPNR